MFKYLSALAILLLASPISFAEEERFSPACRQAAVDSLNANSGTGLAGLTGVNGLLEVATRRQALRLFAAGVWVVEKRHKSSDGNIFPEYEKAVVVNVLGPDGELSSEECDGLAVIVPMTPEEVANYKLEHGSSQEQVDELLDRYGTELIRVAALVDNNQGPASVSNEQLDVALQVAESCEGFGETGDVAKVDNYSETGAVGIGAYGFSYMTAMVGPACMLKATGARIENFRPEDMTPAAQATVSALEEMSNAIQNHGIENINGKDSAHYSIPVDWSQNNDGIYTQINKVHTFIDTENYVYTRRRFEGEMTSNGETRPFFMEKDFDDYRIVPNSNNALYEPYHHVLRMGGILSAADRAEMQEARAKLDEFETQLAAMPASQRQMMEKMMGSKLEQFRTLADDGTFEYEYFTTEIIVNPDFSANTAASALPGNEPNLVQIIQRHLVTLGYDPGKTDGELIKQTVVAITQYEAANHMPVTGQATPQLAEMLAAAVDAQK